MTAAVLIGTAGWSIPRAESGDFPGAGTHLTRYAARMKAAEINTSFYRPHRRMTYERWAASVPEDFRFSVKVPKVVTHEQRLIDTEQALDRFAEEVSGLREKLGVILVQLPPSLPFSAPVVMRFFGVLRERFTMPFACEPRHPTWFTGEADRLLADLGVARVAADPPPSPGGGEAAGWPSLVYMRLHGSPRIYYSDYDSEALAGISDRLRTFRTAGRTVWCIFDNTAAFHALANALTVQAAIVLHQS